MYDVRGCDVGVGGVRRTKIVPRPATLGGVFWVRVVG